MDQRIWDPTPDVVALTAAGVVTLGFEVGRRWWRTLRSTRAVTGRDRSRASQRSAMQPRRCGQRPVISTWHSAIVSSRIRNARSTGASSRSDTMT